MIRGRPSIDQEENDVNDRLEEARENSRFIQSKSLRGRALSNREMKNLEDFQDQER